MQSGCVGMAQTVGGSEWGLSGVAEIEQATLEGTGGVWDDVGAAGFRLVAGCGCDCELEAARDGDRAPGVGFGSEDAEVVR